MTRLSKSVLALAFAWLAIFVLAAPLTAQTITTGNISGAVTDQQGGVLPGATVTAMHKATGTVYTTVAQSDGRYSVLNVRIGEYTLKASLNSFKDATVDSLVVGLGEEKTTDFKLELATVAESITVTATTPPIDLSRAGTGGSVSNEVKEALPTIQRSLTDIARTNPYFNPMGRNDDEATPSVAGRSQRYNSLQIDGAVNNDLFGLAAGGGVPGGAAGTQPISFDAIQELQLVVSPYDIRQGGFSGGGINAVTKSGTNQYRGSLFYYGRNQDWVGDLKLPTNPSLKIGPFSDKQGGFNLGGPIQTNRAFFFVNLDNGRRTTPSGWSIAGSGQEFGNEVLVDRFLTALRTVYGYDLGPNAKDEVSRATNSNKFFARADFNLGNSQLTIRHNYVDALNDSGFISSTGYVFPDGFHRFNSKTNSTVGQLTSRVWAGVNEFRVAMTRVRESRNPQEAFADSPFPRLGVNIVGSVFVNAGLDGPSQRNQLDQDIVEVTNDFTRVFGKHQITIGTHNELFKFRNLFINGGFGQYSFQNIERFEQGLAQRYQYVYSNTDDPVQAARFRVNHFGVYAGDQWRPSGRLTVTYGTRVDFHRFPTTPNRNPVAEDRFGYRTDVVPSNTTFSPRAGFNYSLTPDGTEQVRGGLGLFSGRTPYVWISNQYGNTGIDFTRLDTGSSLTTGLVIPVRTDVNDQYRSLAGLSPAAPLTNEIDVIDPNFKYPSVIRANIAYDRQLPFGIYGTAEFLLTSTVNDVKFGNLNLVQTSTQALDGRPIYARRFSDLTDVILTSNTSEGQAWTIVFEGKRPFSKGFFVNASYLYGESTSVVDGVRDQAASAWGNVFIGGDPNDPPVGRSDYDPGHRFTVSGSYDFKVWRNYSATASIYYSGQSGRPYSLLWGSPGVNGDNQAGNDLFYLPAASDAVVYSNGTYQQLRDYLESRSCTADQIGQIMERNSCRSPWSNTMDARFKVNLPYRKVKAEITMDILNLINLFDSGSGFFRYAAANFIAPATPVLTSGQLTTINLATLTNANFASNEFARNDLRSRWQFQLGARLKF